MTPRAIVTGGAGFIGSHVVDALLAERLRGDRHRRPLLGRRPPRGRAGAAAGARHRRLSRACIGCGGGAAARDLPSRRPGERRGIRGGPGARLRGQRDGHARRGRGRGRGRRVGRVHIHRRSALRRRRAEAHRRGPHPRAAVALRRVEVGRGGVREDVVAVLRDPPRRLPARQRVRPPAEPARRGRRGGDLQPPPAHRAGARSSTATAGPRATMSTSATWSARCSRRRAGRAPTTSPPGSRPTWRRVAGAQQRRRQGRSSPSSPTCARASSSTAAST